MYRKFYKNYSSLYMSPIHYFINFTSFEQVSHPTPKWQGIKAYNDNGINNCTKSFMLTGYIFLSWKIAQESPNCKREINNSKTIHAMTLKFLPKIIIINNSSPTKFHNFWSIETQDIIETSLRAFKNTFQVPILFIQNFHIIGSRHIFHKY